MFLTRCQLSYKFLAFIWLFRWYYYLHATMQVEASSYEAA